LALYNTPITPITSYLRIKMVERRIPPVTRRSYSTSEDGGWLRGDINQVDSADHKIRISDQTIAGPIVDQALQMAHRKAARLLGRWLRLKYHWPFGEEPTDEFLAILCALGSPQFAERHPKIMSALQGRSGEIAYLINDMVRNIEWHDAGCPLDQGRTPLPEGFHSGPQMVRIQASTTQEQTV